MTVVNTGDVPLPFQLGWHPGFRTPLVDGSKRACRLVLPQGRAVRMANDEDCHLTGGREEIELAGDFSFDERQLDATYMFDFSNTPPEKRVATLTDPDGSAGVRVRFGDYPYLGLWSEADAPYICIEPWQGMDDSADQEPFDEKFGIVILPPGASDSRTASIEVVG
jgi:galactose mutarotase-like enzyme